MRGFWGGGTALTIIRGNRESVREHLRRNAIGAYVYVLWRPDSTPFYVGKGGGGPKATFRLFEHEDEARRNHSIGESNPFKNNAIRKIIKGGSEVEYEIESFFGSDAQAAYEREAALIAQYRPYHAGGCLTNLASAIGNAFGLSDYSRQKHSNTLSGIPENNEERRVLNEYLAGIGPVGSVPIKPLSQLNPIRHSSPHPSPRQLTPRLTYALIASTAANELNFTQPVNVPRCFIYNGVRGIIENGVARSLLKAGLATVLSANDPREEQFVMTNAQCRLLGEIYGVEELRKRDLI